MNAKVIIYGKAGWPYTQRARSAYQEHEYVDVKQSKQNMEAMLKCTGGQRNVPVIVEGGNVTVGYGGSWGVWLVGLVQSDLEALEGKMFKEERDTKQQRAIKNDGSKRTRQSR